ncbi:MAG: transporter, partial [Phenylobacterium sp.]|nr:transporter [Phenylobacterium sp.]
MPSDLPLWRQGDFRRLWAAQAVSDFGARITRDGLPMMAVLALAASPAQLGLLAALAGAPALLVGLSAGGLVDRSRRRTLLIAADLVRAAVLVTLPLAAWLRVLGLGQVFAAAALVAAASALFDIADHAYLPSLVGRDRLTEANARIGATESLAEMGGPALAGLLFQWLTAPFAVAVNAATYLVSAAFLARIASRESRPEPQPRARRWLDGVRTGAAAAWREPVVRPLLGLAIGSSLFGGIFSALYIVFALRTLGLTPALLGVTIATGGAGALAGSLMAQPLARAIGAGPAILASALAASASALLIPLSPPGVLPAMTSLIAAQLLGDSFGVVTLILAVSLRQSRLPVELLGRTGAAFQAAAGAAAVAGAL